MRFLIAIVILSSYCMAQGAITGLGPYTSDYNVVATKAADGTFGTVRTITCTAGTCVANVQLRTNAQLTWANGNSITLTASGTPSNGDSIVDASCLGTVTLTASDNPNHNYTFTSACSPNFSAAAHDYEIPYQECDQNGNLWQVMRKAPATGSYGFPEWIALRIAMTYPGCSGGAATNPTWTTVTGPLFQYTAVTCTTGSNGPADIRNFSFGKIIHGGVTTFVLMWMTLCSDGVFFSRPYYAYIDNPDASNPLTGWSSTVNGASGIPGTIIPTFSFNSHTHTPHYTYGRMFCTKLDCSEIGSMIINDVSGGGSSFMLIVSTDGHTWAAKTTLPNVMGTNETTGALLQDNDHMLVFSRQQITTTGQCANNLCNMNVMYTSNLQSTSPLPSWTFAVAHIPHDSRNTASGASMASPELRCHVLGNNCWLVYTDRYGYSSVNQGSLKSWVFDPTLYTSTLDFSTATPQNIYDSVSINSLEGYSEPFLSTNGHDLAMWWHDMNYITGTPLAPLNLFNITGSLNGAGIGSQLVGKTQRTGGSQWQ